MSEMILDVLGFGLDLQLFAEAGNLVNATGGYVNAYTGDVTAFSGSNDLTAGMKEYYDTALLEFAKETFIYQQLGKKQRLPRNRGKSVEWRKFNTMPDADVLREAVIPVGKKLGQSAVHAEITEYGMYYAVSDVLELHHVDPIISEYTERLAYSMGRTYEKIIRNELSTCTNVLYAEVLDESGKVESQPQTRQALKTALEAGKNANLTMRVIAKAANLLTKANAPKYSGNEYLCVANPSNIHDLRVNDPNWVEVHKYANPEPIYNGEVGKAHGVRFVETTLAPVIKGDGDKQAIYQPMVFGRDAFAVVDPEGAGLEMIHKSKDQVGGPLNQFSTIGAKMALAAKVLYPERMVVIECGSTEYGDIDEDNFELEHEETA